MIPYFSLNEIIIGPISVHVWGIAASLAFLSGLFISLKQAEKNGIDKDQIWDIMIIALFSMIAGSKAFFALFSAPNDFWGAMFSAGGFSFFGGMIFAALAVYVYARKKRMNILRLADTLTPGLAVSMVIMRIGCFFSYEHVGKITTFPWAQFHIDGSARHPVSLYLILADIVILSSVCYLKKRNAHLKEGVLFLCFAVLFLFFRLILDFSRCTDLSFCELRFFGFTFTQLIMLAALPVSLYSLRANK